jgi:NodT family efflux transporter outer membrane factor (OMF) lipoprotein
MPANAASAGLRLVLSIGLAFAQCGCTSFRDYVHNGFKVGPSYREPAAPVARDWIDAADNRVRKDAEEPSQWWKVFGDPILDGMVCDAYRQNLNVRQAAFKIVQARAVRAIAVGNLFPQTQQLTGDYNRFETSRETAGNRTSTTPRYFGQWDTSFGAAWELDFWGRYRRAIEAASADLDASIDNHDAVLVTLLGDLAANYVQLRTLDRRIELLKANVELQRETLSIAEARFKAGQASELDVDQSRTTLAQTEAFIPPLEIVRRAASNHLATLLGVPPQNLDARLGKSPIPTAPGEVAVGIPADLIRRRPDVRQAERHAAAESARIGVAESEFYPHLSIVGSFGYSAESFNRLFTPKAQTGQIGPDLRWNILNYGRILNGVRFQDAVFQEAVAAYQQSVLNAGEEVENGIVGFLKNQERVKALDAGVIAAEKAVKVVVAQYKGGLTDFNRVAVLQQTLVQQQDAQAQAQGDIALSLIQIYRALGGGWQIRRQGCEATFLAGPPPRPSLLPPTQP